MRIYDRSLNSAEVASDMEAPLQTPQQGPVAAWSFDEGEGTTVEDVTGNGHTATIEGARWTTHGRYGDALEFDGSEDCLAVAPASDLQLTGEFTVEAWVRPGASMEAGALLAKENSVSPHYGYLLEDEGEHLSAYFDESAESGHLASAEGSLPLHTWTHLALTDDGAHTRLYVDGELVGTTAAVPMVETDGDLRIGCDKIWNEYFDGRIDEVQIYERALSGAEVAADSEQPLQTPQQGPVAAYSFDAGEGATVEDVTGEGHTATIEGAQWTTHGRYGDAMEFDGGQCVSVPNSESLQLTEAFTVEAWVKLQGLPTDDPIFFKETEGDYSYAMDVGFGNEGDPAGFLDGEELVGPSPVESDVWTHIAFTYDGSRTRLFVDGQQVASAEVGPLATESEGPLYIGCDGPVWGDHLRGRIDEVRIYNRSLNGAEVAADMEAPLETPRQGPVAAYSFDEGGGTTVEDLTGDGHTATIHGAKWTTHGRYGDALEFDGAEEDYVSVPASEELDQTEEFTVEAWVRPTEATSLATILMKERSGGEPHYSWALKQHVERPRGYLMEEEGPEGEEGSLPLRVWTHLGLTDDGAHTRLYVNGELVDTGPAVPVEGDGEIRIGGDGIWGDWFTGRIDEVRIYNRALGENELDFTPPTAPRELEALLQDEEGDAGVYWTPSVDPPSPVSGAQTGVGFYRYRTNRGGTWGPWATTQTPFFEVTGGSSGETFSVQVQAVDKAFNSSEVTQRSVEVHGSTLTAEEVGEEARPGEWETVSMDEEPAHPAIEKAEQEVIEEEEKGGHFSPLYALGSDELCEGYGENPCGTYNSKRAAEYGYEWIIDEDEARYNHEFLYLGGKGGDCTNFTSQILWAGGMNFARTHGYDEPDTEANGEDHFDDYRYGQGSWWEGYYYIDGEPNFKTRLRPTESFVNAEKLRDHLVEYGLIEKIPKGQPLHRGNILFYNEHGNNPNALSHSQTVLAVTPGKIWVGQHSVPEIRTLRSIRHKVDRERGPEGVAWEFWAYRVVHTRADLDKPTPD